MRIDLTQKIFSPNYHFDISIDGNPAYKATANRTVWPFLRKVVLTDLEQNQILTMKQRNIFLRFIERIWIYGCPFIVSRNKEEIGWMRSWFRLGQPTGKCRIGNSEYRVFIHRGNIISIRTPARQIGLIRREPWKEWDGDEYHADFDDDIDPLLGTMFLLFTDIVWFTSDASSYAHQKTEYIPVRGVEEETDWSPNVNM